MEIHRCRFVDYAPHTITALAFSHAGNGREAAPKDLRLAVGRSNGDIEIWNPRWSWVHEKTLKGGVDRTIEGLAWSAVPGSAPRLFSIGGSTSIAEWDLETGQVKATHDCHSGVVWSLAASPDGTKLAAGCENGTVVVVDIEDGAFEHYKILQRHNARVMSLAWRNKGQIVGGCSDARIRIWSVGEGRIVSTMKVDRAKREDTMVWSVAVLKGGKQIVSGDSTGSVKFWGGSNFSLSQSFSGHEADVLCLAPDASGTTVFSAGVDRKIVQYKMVSVGANGGSSGNDNNQDANRRWANVSSRLLHSHDIRAMACFEAKGASFLVSGGVECSLVVNSARDFVDGIFRKIPPTPQRPTVQVVPEPRLVVMWADQAVKIWKIDEYDGEAAVEGDDGALKGKRLVAKLALSNEENLTGAAVSPDGGVLAVTTLVETKLFTLRPSADGRHLVVSKADTQPLAATGAVCLSWTPDSRVLVVVTPQAQVVVYDAGAERVSSVVDLSDDDEDNDNNNNDSEDDCNAQATASLVAVSDAGDVAAIARGTAIDLVNTKRGQRAGSLPQLRSAPTALKFTPRGTLAAVTAENRVYEFDVTRRTLTPWSRRNSDLLPTQLVSLVDKCAGVFFEPSRAERMWLFGATWLAFVDLGLNFARERVPKRKLDRLGVLNGDDDAAAAAASVSGISLTRVSDSPRSDDGSSAADGDARPFWITYKYRPLLIAATLGAGELAVVERPTHDVPKSRAFWASHHIRM